MGHWIELVAADGATISAWRSEPSGKPRGGLVVAQEIFGVNSHIRSVCEGYAADGYLAIAPALFDRIAPRVDLGYTPEDIEKGRALKARTTLDHALADVEAARQIAAHAGKVGIVGYCWGGYVAWMAAARLAGFACAIPYYGGGMLEAIGEHPRCPVLAHFGEKDKMIPVKGVRELAAAHPEANVHVYPANHGFNCDQRGSYDAPSAKLARERTLEFLRTHVG
ncbi:MAG: dienelactone hydrolase family protein [Betaproteobacteria bacterium]